MKKLTLKEAKLEAVRMGWDFTKDFHAQGNFSMKCELADLARKTKYRAPQNANGSIARCFFERLAKLAAKAPAPRIK